MKRWFITGTDTEIDRRYWRHWGERLGVVTVKGPVAFHIHAASLGEVNAAGPLVNALLEQTPAPDLLLTTFTPTGRQRARELFGTRIGLCYLPLDLPLIAARFLRTLQPAAIVVVETEIWPNLYAAAARANTPLIISNARLSQASLRAYRRCRRLIDHAGQSVGPKQGALRAAQHFYLTQVQRTRDTTDAGKIHAVDRSASHMNMRWPGPLSDCRPSSWLRRKLSR